MIKTKENVTKLNNYLNLDRQIVGVKFLKTKEDFDNSPGRKLTHIMAYCTMVRNASKGHCIKADVNNFACLASAMAVGLVEPSKADLDGTNRVAFGAYKNLEISKKVSENMVYCSEKNYGVNIMPLSEFKENPDIVIIVTNNFNMMRIAQGYAYFYGHVKNAKFSGMQAMCQECTSYPYMTDDINFSFMCAGTRMLCQWKDSEMAVGLPFNRFDNLVEGVKQTINPLERDKNKKIIEDKINSSNFKDDLNIKYNDNYDDGYYIGLKLLEK